MSWNSLYDEQAARLEDFWARRESGPRVERAFTLFGRPVRLSSNVAGVLPALDDSLPLFSRAPRVEAPPFDIHLVVRESPQASGPLPAHPMAQAQYTGHAHWLMISFGPWGHCTMDLAQRRAVGVLAPQWLASPAMLSRALLNTLLTNIAIGGGGFGMMHATGLVRGDHALLLMAPHNSGKSTTALRLALAGYQFLSDSQVYVSPDEEALALLGFPVGLAKLRQDMVPHFPALRPLLAAEPVRDEIKFTVDLRRLDSALVREEVVRPARVTLCLLQRGEGETTTVHRATWAEVEAAVMENSIFYDARDSWLRNLAQIERCLERARWRHLHIGTDPQRLIATVNQLMDER